MRSGKFVVCLVTCGFAIGTTACGDGDPDPTQVPASKPSVAPSPNEADMIAVQQKYPAAYSALMSQLAIQVELKGRSAARVTEIFRPDLDAAAYLEFALQMDSKDAGYVIVSTGAHDVPIVAWSESGPGNLRALERRHRRDLSSARLFMLGAGVFAAELGDGTVLAAPGLLRAEAWRSAKQHFIEQNLALQGKYAEQINGAWLDLANGDRSVVLPPEIFATGLRMCPVEGCNGTCQPGDPDPGCKPVCAGQGHFVRGADLVPPPSYNQFQAWWNDGFCWSGCTPTAFAMIAAWASQQAGDHRDGSAWGHPRMAYAFAGPSDTWPRQHHDGEASAVMSQLRGALGTYCSDGAGNTSAPAASDRAGQYFNSLGAPINTWELTNGDQGDYEYDIADRLINAKVPVEVNAPEHPWGDAGHSWILWGYTNNSCSGEFYRVNMGWGGDHDGWVSKWTIINNITNGGWFTRYGTVNIGTQNLWRDHGPITTTAGNGTNYCFDVAGWDTSDNALIQQYACHGGDNQLWYLDRSNDAGWQIRSRFSGKCVAVQDSGQYNGARIVQTTCNKSDTNQLWRMQKRGARVRLQHQASWRCVDLDSAGGFDGNDKVLQVWDCHEDPNQQFDFRP